METPTKILLAAGGLVVAGAAVAIALRRSRRASFFGLPSKPWHSDVWDDLKPHRRQQAIQEWYEQSGRSIMSDVAEFVNTMGGESEAGRALGRGLYRQHRTLQSNFFRALPDLFAEYVRQAEQFGTDPRNEAAVRLARKLEQCARSEPLPFL